MCGIAGIVGNGSVEIMKRMTNQLVHRGPDDEGIWHEPDRSVFLGHRRLSILDLGGGHQPMWTADGRHGVVFNGEIYNFQELREQLSTSGHSFRTDHSDTEVLLLGYREWGERLPERLNGMWAFALYDRDRRMLFCSRDRFGKKPFYYTRQGGIFAFASELNALREHPGLRFTQSPCALKKYFGYGYIPAPLTIYEEVAKLPAAHSMVLDLRTGDLRVSRYWNFKLEPEYARPVGYEDQCAEEVADLLDKAVKRRLVSDVPIGIFLSGGIDSSAIAAIAARHLPRGALRTFSIGFEESSYDESRYALQVAKLVGSDHTSEILSIDRAAELLPAIVRRLDEPLGDSSLLPTFLLCNVARKHVTVALGGDGSDEMFGGYAPFRALRWARLYQRLVPRPLHHVVLWLARRLPTSHSYMSVDFKIKRTLGGLSHAPHLWNPVWMSSLDERQMSEFFREPVHFEDVFSEAIELWDSCRGSNEVDRTLQFFTRLYLQEDILAKVDRASMMNSLEARSPFLDIDLVERVRKIPSNLKLRNGETKYILKRALRNLLPQHILFRAKQGFAVPVGRWFNEGRLRFENECSSGMWDRRFAGDRLTEHRQDRVDNRLFLWNYWVLNGMGLKE